MKKALFLLAVMSAASVTIAGWVPMFNGTLYGESHPLFSGGMDNTKPLFYDLDGDGDADLIWSNEGDDYMKLWENTGTAIAPAWSMVSETWFNLGGDYTPYPAIGDLDNDGDLDMIIGYHRNLHYYDNTGGSLIDPSVTLIDDEYLGHYTTSATPTPFLVDIDNDLDLDLFVGEGENRIWFYRNIGDVTTPNFTMVDSEYFIPPAYAWSIAYFFDMDLDSDYDFIFQGNRNTYLSRNSGTASIPAWESYDSLYFPHLSNSARGVSLWDLYGTGLPCLVTGSEIRLNHFFTNTGTIAIPNWVDAPQPWETIEVSYRGRIEMPDLTDDGLPEMLIFGYNYELALRNVGTSGSPAWEVDSALIDGLWETNMNPTFGDLDNDGDLDAVIGTTSDDLKYYENIGDSTNPIWGTVVDDWFSIIHRSYMSPALVDIDNDDDLDLFVGDGSDTIFFYENTGTPTVPNFPSGVIVADFTPAHSREFLYRPGLCFFDYDGDGDFDLLAGQDDGDCKLTYWENTGDAGSPSWEAPVTDYVDTAVAGLSDVEVFDYNGDGDNDLICATYDGGVMVYIWDEFVGIANSGKRPDKISLSAYPTPFNSAVTISLSVIPATSSVIPGLIRNPEIEIYDLNGRIVAEIPANRSESAKPSSTFASGAYRWQPDESLGSGVYLVRARFDRLSDRGEESVTKRVVYLK